MRNEIAHAFLQGAVAMASGIVSLFFLKFWRQTRDRFFLFFALAFAMDAVTRIVLTTVPIGSEQEPLAYMGRLVMFSLIIAAIIDKNTRKRLR